MKYLLGIDGGSSKTHALLADSSGQVLGFGKSGSTNHQSYGLQSALSQIELAARQALEGTGVSPEQVDLGYFCLAGADLPSDFVMLQQAIEALVQQRALVTAGLAEYEHAERLQHDTCSAGACSGASSQRELSPRPSCRCSPSSAPAGATWRSRTWP